MMGAMLDMLVAATLVASAAILMVLAIRLPARRWFDARLAYVGWWLVPAALIALAVPKPVSFPVESLVVSPPAAVSSPTAMLPITPDAVEPAYWLLAWSIGALCTFALMVAQQHRYTSRLGMLSPTKDAGVFQANTPGPLLVGLLKPKVVLPLDAGTRYGHQELELIVAHEQVHASRHDLWANAMCAAMQVIFWFNPLVHIAARCFRYDQELACDEAVLEQFPGARKAYANAIMKTQLSSQGAPFVANWRTSHPLKGRMMNLNATKPGQLRRAAGKVSLAAVVACACSGVWAYAAVAGDSGQKVDVSARIAFGSNPEKVISLKGVDFPGTPLKVGVEPDCQYEMSLAPQGDTAAFVDVKIQCAGKVVADPKIAARFGEQAKIKVADATGQQFSMSVTVTKAAPK